MSLGHLRLLLLTAFLLFTQLGGLLHGLSHQGDDKERPHAACQLCAAYSALDHGTLGQVAPPAFDRAFIPAAPKVLSVTERPPRFAYRTRAPPHLA